VLLAGGVLVWLWGFSDFIRQDRFIFSVVTLSLGGVLLLLWWVLLSRAAAKWRWGVLAIVLLAAVAVGQMVRITGVSGDLVPILGWKWSPPEGEPGAVIREGRAEPAGEFDYPQFLGPNRNATISGIGLARDWQSRPPEEIWRRPVGEAWSGFAVVGDWAVTQEQHGPEERVVAYDLETGEIRWQHGDRTRYETTIAGIGPRATPTIVAGRVYTVGATGILNALELETGELLWSHQVLEEHGAPNKNWGKSCSPLVVDDLVVVSVGAPAGKSLVAYRRDSGELAWTGGSDRSSYSSPLVATLAGVRQIVIVNKKSVVGHALESGRVLWSQPWLMEQPSVAQPLSLGQDRLLVSAGYGMGSKLFGLASGEDGGLAATLLWESPRLKSKFANFVFHRGYVYGLDDGVLVCLDPETGERCWKRGRYGHGQVILADDLLIVQSERGEIVLVEPNPEELRELGRFTAFQRKTWNPPTLVGPYLLVRNDQEAALFELPSSRG
jgi:outer membrane protein assembly factor BamB